MSERVSADYDRPPPIVNDFPHGCSQVVLTKELFDWFQASVRARGLYLFPIPIGPDEDLPTFGIGVPRHLMSAVFPSADPEPQPTDGPDYHADHAAWTARQTAPIASGETP